MREWNCVVRAQADIHLLLRERPELRHAFAAVPRPGAAEAAARGEARRV